MAGTFHNISERDSDFLLNRLMVDRPGSVRLSVNLVLHDGTSIPCPFLGQSAYAHLRQDVIWTSSRNCFHG